MFIGHYAPAIAAAALPRAPSLGLLFVAAQLVDFAFFGFVLTGVEHMRAVPGYTVMSPFDLHHMPYTHSLIGSLGFAGLWAFAARLSRLDWPTAWLGAAVVASHWLLDWLVHVPDLTILGVGPRHGLGLWDRPEIAMPLELALVALALTFYAGRTRGPALPLALLAAAMLAVQLINWTTPHPAVMLDPVPASLPLTALAAFAALALLAAWAGSARRPA